jgi:hypothetical protein
MTLGHPMYRTLGLLDMHNVVEMILNKTWLNTQPREHIKPF